MWGKKKKPKLDENGKPIPEPKKSLADKDKIFNNTYGDQDITENKVNFTVASTYRDDMDPDDKMHYDLLIKKIDKLIKGSVVPSLQSSLYCLLQQCQPVLFRNQ